MDFHTILIFIMFYGYFSASILLLGCYIFTRLVDLLCDINIRYCFTYIPTYIFGNIARALLVLIVFCVGRSKGSLTTVLQLPYYLKLIRSYRALE